MNALSKEQAIQDLSTRFALASLFFKAVPERSDGEDEWTQRYESELEKAREVLDACAPSELKEIFSEMKIEDQSDVIKNFLARYFLEQLLTVEDILNSSRENQKMKDVS